MSNNITEVKRAFDVARRQHPARGPRDAGDAARMARDLVERLLDVARERRRERVVLELVCVHWELSHLSGGGREDVERRLGQRFSVSAFGQILEDSLWGRSAGPDWRRLFSLLGL